MNSAQAERRKGTQSLDRAIALLLEVSERSPIGCRLIDLAEATGVSRPTAHRLLGRLVDAGLITRERGTHLYKAGPLVHTFESMNARKSALTEAGLPSLKRIVARINHTTLLVSRSGRFSHCCARIDGREANRTAFGRVGGGGLLGASATSIAIMAGLHDEQVDDILFENGWMLFEYGGDSIDNYRRLIAETRKKGYCMTHGQFIAGVSGVAVALPAPMGRSFAAVSILTEGSLSPKDVREAVALLKEEAAAISACLGQMPAFSWLRPAVDFHPDLSRVST